MRAVLLKSVGSGSIVTVQEAILAHWFHGRGLAITIGLQISLSRLVRALRRARQHYAAVRRAHRGHRRAVPSGLARAVGAAGDGHRERNR